MFNVHTASAMLNQCRSNASSIAAGAGAPKEGGNGVRDVTAPVTCTFWRACFIGIEADLVLRISVALYACLAMTH